MSDAIRTLTAGPMRVSVYRDRDALGRAAARSVAANLKDILGRQARAGAVFAAAASQVEFLTHLAAEPGVDWGRVTAFHLDEYIGVSATDARSFARFLRERLFDQVKPAAFHALDGAARDPEAECRRYEALLRDHPLDVACIGIGENGHLAFNDPHVAYFEDPRHVKVVDPDDRSRRQQVADGCFTKTEEMPGRAYTLTIPAILAARFVHVMVPGDRKAEAVRRTLEDPVSTACPATVLRTRSEVYLYVDAESSRGIDRQIVR
ncbi:MAG: glucosamine-6-phosphate deaminase [Candidatus Rokuibacteriota bacterium]